MRKLVPFILAVLLIGAAFSVPLLLKVRVVCKSQYGACPGEVDSSLSTFSGKSIYRAENGVKKALKKNPMVTDFSIQYKVPNFLFVNILLNKPVFAVKDTASGKFGLVDASGKILSISDNSGLPAVITSQNLKLGESVDKSTLFALQLMGGVYEMYQVASGQISDGSLVVELPPRFNVTFPLEGDAQVLLGELRLVYAKTQSSPELGSYTQIDLRFKNPVLR